MTTASLTQIDILNADVKTVLENSEEYQELIANIDTAIEEAQELAIVTANDVNTASHYVKNLKSVSKKVNDFRLELTRPLDDKKKEIKSFLDKIIDKLERPLNQLEKEILEFQRKERAEAAKKAEAERKRREEEALQKAIEIEEQRKQRLEVINTVKSHAEELKESTPEATKEDIRQELTGFNGFPNDITEEEWGYILGDLKEIVQDTIEPAIVEEVEQDERKISQLNTSGVHTRRTKTFEIVDETKIPREYLKVDEQKIRAERSKHDYEAPSNIPGVKFTFNETVV
jgi:hypothetical protein